MRVAGFTGDTLLTIDVAHAILTGDDVAHTLKTFAQEYHALPYGQSFRNWIWSWENKPYNSFGGAKKSFIL